MKRKSLAKILTMTMIASIVTSLCPATLYAATGSEVAKDGTYTSTKTVVNDLENDDEWENYVVPSIADDNDITKYLGRVTDGYTTRKGEYCPGCISLVGKDATYDTINNSWDTVSSATYTSKAVKEALLEAIKSAPAAGSETEEVKTADLEAAIAAAKALTESDYTAESWKNLQTALDAAKKLTDATAEQTVVDQAASDLETAILALVKADTENTGTTDKKKKPAVGTVKTVGQIKYKVTGKNTVTVNKYAKKNITKASIPATVKINGYTFKVTAIADSAFSGCSKLTKVTVGSNVRAIGNKSFYKCTKLTTFTASSTGLNKIGKEAFSGDKKLANITLKTTKLKKSGVGKDAFKNIKKNATFKVPAKKVSDYKAIFKSKGAGKNIKVKKL